MINSQDQDKEFTPEEALNEEARIAQYTEAQKHVGSAAHRREIEEFERRQAQDLPPTKKPN